VKIGVLTMAVAPTSPHANAFRQGMREHGYVEGRNLSIEYRFADGDPQRIPTLAAELARLDLDVVVTESYQAALAMKQATAKTPIVTAAIADPVKLGLAASYSQPGGNITGLTLVGADRTSKQLQLLKELLPQLSRVVVMHNSAHPDDAENTREARSGAQALNLTVHFVAVRSPADLQVAFATVAKLAPDGLVTIGDGMLLNHHRAIAAFVAKQRLPAAFPEKEFAVGGGLLAYGPSVQDGFRRSAAFVDKILKGAKPGDLPIERPSKFDLVINLTAARTLGLKIPPALLVRADEVLQ
jgi:putative ABC transport system substrate-binding protein